MPAHTKWYRHGLNASGIHKNRARMRSGYSMGQRSVIFTQGVANDGGFFDFKIIHPANDGSEIVDRETFGQPRLTTTRRLTKRESDG